MLEKNKNVRILYPSLPPELKAKIDVQLWDCLEIKSDLLEGMGVFTTKNIQKGEVVCNYGGQIHFGIDPDLNKCFEADNKFVAEILFLGEKVFFHHGDGVPPTWGKFINYSSKYPNVRPRIYLGENNILEIIFLTQSLTSPKENRPYITVDPNLEV